MAKWNNAEFGGLPSVVVAAHELKSPLALVRQMSLLLDDQAISETDAKRLRQQLIYTSERSLRLVDDLARVGNLNPALFPLEPLNPLAVCQQLAIELRPTLQLYQRQVCWPANRRRPLLVMANRVLLGRIVTNFLDNALKYSDPTLAVQVSLRQIGPRLRLSVRDYGPMLSRQEYRQLIDQLHQRKSIRTRPDSSGLGVFVASQFAEAMQGSIGLVRHRDGVTFYVELPVSRQLRLV